MKIKVSVFIATSLDGFIARKDGSIDWLEKANTTAQAGEDCGYHEFMSSIDTIVMGRNTFEKVLSFGDWPYKDKKVIVLSTKLSAIPSHLPKTVSIISLTPSQVLEKLSSQGVKHIYIDGGNTIQRFLADNLVDEMTITRIPVLLGEGLPLFGSLTNDTLLTHLKTISYELGGFVQSKYRVINDRN